MSSPKLNYKSLERKLESFIKLCEYVLCNVVETLNPLILEVILAKLSGRAD